MSKPRPLTRKPETDYPSLREHLYDRRGFIRKLALGAASIAVGNGFLAGCARTTDPDRVGNDPTTNDHEHENDDFPIAGGLPVGGGPPDPPEDQDAGPPDPPPDAGSYDAGSYDAGQPDADDPDAEPPMGGIPPIPGYSVRLPEIGFTGTYLLDDEYLTYAVLFRTDTEAFARHYSDNRAEAYPVINAVLADWSCRTVQDDSWELGLALTDALLEDYRLKTGLEGYIQSLEVIVDRCEVMRLAGEPPPPDP